MFPILAVTLAWIPALVGIGALVRHGGDPGLRLPVAGLLGCGLLGVVATVLNFAVPISPPVAAAFWIVGIAVAVVRRRWVLEEIRILDLVATLTVAIAIVRFARAPESMLYDNGLYHLQTVSWIREHAAVPGLANLHHRLGFGSVWHVVAAALEVPFATGRSLWFANALPAVFAGSAAVIALHRLVEGDRSFSNVFLAGVLLPVVAATTSFPGVSTDHVAALSAYLSIALWTRALEDRPWPGRDAEAATLLAVFALLVKISTIVVFAASAALLVLRWRHTERGARVRTAAMAAFAVVPWLARNLVLSGCLVFPAAATCVPWLSWSFGTERTRQVDDLTRAWAREALLPPEQVLAGWSWLSRWPTRYRSADHELLLLLLATGLLLWLVLARRAPRALAIPFAVSATGMAFWFFTAPDPRFAYGYIFPLALLPLAFALTRPAVLTRTWARVALAVGVLAVSGELLARVGTLRAAPGIAIPYLAWPTLAAVATEVQVTRSGLAVRTPSSGDQCWDTPLPCTPEFRPDFVWSGGVMRVDRTAPPRGSSAAAR